MPDEFRRLPEIVGDRVKSIVIAIAAGKNNDAKFHGFCFRGAVVFILPEAAAAQSAEAARSCGSGTGWVAERLCLLTKIGGKGRAKLRLMRTPACVAAGLLFLWSVVAPAQPAKFAGTWEAAHEGKIFLVLKIQADKKISGTLNAGSIRLSDEGELLEAEPVEDREAPFLVQRAALFFLLGALPRPLRPKLNFLDYEMAVCHRNPYRRWKSAVAKIRSRCHPVSDRHRLNRRRRISRCCPRHRQRRQCRRWTNAPPGLRLYR
jgi:hypothetical protein